MLIAYARVSKLDVQDTAAQLHALERESPDRIYHESVTSRRWADRPELQRMLDNLRQGDEILVWKLDRIIRTYRDFASLVDTLTERKVHMRSIVEGISTAGPMGTAILGLLTAVAQIELTSLSERTRLGLEHARANGRVGGRPRKLSRDQRAEVLRNIASGLWSPAQAARLMGVHPSTISRLLAGNVLDK